MEQHTSGQPVQQDVASVSGTHFTYVSEQVSPALLTALLTHRCSGCSGRMREQEEK